MESTTGKSYDSGRSRTSAPNHRHFDRNLSNSSRSTAWFRPLPLLLALLLLAPNAAWAAYSLTGGGYTWSINSNGTVSGSNNYSGGAKTPYDTGMTLTVNGSSFPSSSITELSANSAIRLGPANNLGATGLNVTREVYVYSYWARWTDKFTNTTSSAITVPVSVRINLWQDSYVTYAYTSGLTSTSSETYLVTNPSTSGLSSPAMMHYFKSYGGQAFSAVPTVGGSCNETTTSYCDSITVTWSLTIPANDTVYLMYFASQRETAADAYKSLNAVRSLYSYSYGYTTNTTSYTSDGYYGTWPLSYNNAPAYYYLLGDTSRGYYGHPGTSTFTQLSKTKNFKVSSYLLGQNSSADYAQWDLYSGAYVSDGHGDAYDGGHRLKVNETTYSGGFVGTEQSGRAMLFATQTMSGLEVKRLVYSPTGTYSMGRWLDTFYNPTTSPITAKVEVYGNLGSDSSTVIARTSSGDTTVTVADYWFVTDDSSDGTSTSGNDPAILHYFWWSGGIKPHSLTAAAGDDDYSAVYYITVPPGSTRSLEYVEGQYATRADAISAASTMTSWATSNSSYLVGYGSTSTACPTAANGQGNTTTNCKPLTLDSYPLAYPITASVAEDNSSGVTISIPDYNATGSRSFSIPSTSTKGGTITVTSSTSSGQNAGRKVKYVPPSNFCGADTFTYRITDGITVSNTVTIKVSCQNDAPYFDSSPTSVSTSEDTTKTFEIIGYDNDGTHTYGLGSISYTGFSSTYGTLSVSTATVAETVNTTSGVQREKLTNTYTYKPAANWNGSFTLTFTLRDGAGVSVTKSVPVTVTPVNDAPTVQNIEVATPEYEPVTITLVGSDVETAETGLTYTFTQPTSGGSVACLDAPRCSQVEFTPSVRSGEVTFTYQASDGSASSTSATVTVYVAAVNHAPVATGGSFTTNEDTAQTYQLIASDQDPGDSLTFSTSQGANGTVSVNASGLVTYTPRENFYGNDSFTFTVRDNGVPALSSNTALVTVTVNAVNDRPTATAQSVSTDEDTPVTITMGWSDVDNEEVDMTFSLYTQPSNGTAQINGNRVTYTPNANWHGTDSFQYRVSDGQYSAQATITVTVNSVNDVPVATAQSVSLNEDGSKAITLAASDADGDALTYTIVNMPSHGALSGTAPNLTYTPNANYNGSDSFSFKVSDGKADSNTATVSISISAVNDAPEATAQEVNVDEDSSVSITLAGTDGDGDTLTYMVMSQPTNGRLTGSAPNMTYTPNANFYGQDEFTFMVRDSGGLTSMPVAVHIVVSAVNDDPVATAQSVSLSEDGSLEIILVGSDIDQDPLTYIIVTEPQHGTLMASGTIGTYIYEPEDNYNGADYFTFKVNDSSVDSAEARVSITVNAVNDAPVASGPETVTLDEDTTKAITLVASDVDGDTLTYSILAQPSHGTITGTAPNLTYKPEANYHGSDSFSFKVNDGKADSETKTVSITVNSVNDVPVADAQTISLEENAKDFPITLTASDADGDDLTYTVMTQPTMGSLNGSAPNLTYTPPQNTNGTTTFTFKVNDGKADSAVATVTITVDSINYAPVLYGESEDEGEVREGETLTYEVRAFDADGDTLTWSIISGLGSIDSATGLYSWTPEKGLVTEGALGVYTVKIQVSDNYSGPESDRDGELPTMTLTITVLSDDRDHDGVPNDQDNCPDVDNPPDIENGNTTQADMDGDGLGDACDDDMDGDSLSNELELATCYDIEGVERCLDPANPDTDGDGINDGIEAGALFNQPTDGHVLYAIYETTNEAGETIQESRLLSEGEPEGVAWWVGVDIYGFDKDTLEPGDGVIDVVDKLGVNTDSPGRIGDGLFDALDSDGDGIPNFFDTDSDNDGVLDIDESGMTDPEVTAPADKDADGLPDYIDTDSDGDGVPDNQDNCRVESNEDQANLDGDTLGDACDDDIDGDGVANDVERDTCSTVEGGDQPTMPEDYECGEGTVDVNCDGLKDDYVCDEAVDSDCDGVEENGADEKDNCPNLFNPFQNAADCAESPIITDRCHHAEGCLNPCGADTDGDGILDGIEFGSGETAVDSDGDGMPDALDTDSDNDGVPDMEEVVPGQPPADTDSDGIVDYLDTDSDNDGILDGDDNCRIVENPDQQDTDSDGEGDACADDTDGDGVLNHLDNCPAISNADQSDVDSDGTGDLCDDDIDGDNYANADDNCSSVANADQADMDSDGIGDVCDDDRDGDGVANTDDNCPDQSNADQVDICTDSDGDGITDNVDNCPNVSNPNQADSDGNGVGDKCDDDSDGDGVANADDNCPDVANEDQADWNADGKGDACSDTDSDGVMDSVDNCREKPNPNQMDSDADGIGDECEESTSKSVVTEGGCSSAGTGVSAVHLLAMLMLGALIRRRRA